MGEPACWMHQTCPECGRVLDDRGQCPACAGHDVHLRRIHDDDPVAGARVLVDGLWPRGVRKADAALDWWARDVAPSNDLRRWYGHDPDRFEQFRDRYQRELDDEPRRTALDRLVTMARDGDVVLLTATRAVEISHAAVLADVLRRAR